MTNKYSIDPETLAALLDGKLNEQDAALVRDQLSNADQATIDAYMDAVAINAALSEGEPTAQQSAANYAISIPMRPRPRWWIGASVAGLAAAALLVVVVRSRNAANEFEPRAYAVALASEATSTTESVINTIRGGTASTSERTRAVRVGVFLADMEIGIKHGRDVSTESRAIAAILRDVPGATALAGVFDKAAATPSLNADENQRLDNGRNAMKRVGENLARTGAYLESARIASQSNDSAFFNAFAPGAMSSAASDLPEPLRQSLINLISAIEKKPRDLKAVYNTTDSMLRSLAN